MTTALEAYARIANLSGVARENELLNMVREGLLAPLAWAPIATSYVTPDGTTHRAEFEVSSDFLGFGTPDSPFRPGWMAATAQVVADLFDAYAPTPLLAEVIRQRAQVRLSIHAQGEPRDASATYWTHNQAVEQERRGRLGLTDGHQKSIVVAADSSHVAIYGGSWENGELVQGLNTSSHDNEYLDYSHGLRLVRLLRVDGVPMRLGELAAHPTLWPLVSKAGPLASARIPAKAPAGLGTRSVPVVAYASGGAAASPSLVGVLASGASGAGAGAEGSSVVRALGALAAIGLIIGGAAWARSRGWL